MAFSSFVALRYLKNNRANRFVSWITILCTIGIALGVAVMIVVLSVFNGFEDALRERFLAANAHVLVYRFPAGLKHPAKWEKAIHDKIGDELSGVSPFVHAETMGSKDHFIHSVLVRGIDAQKRESVQTLRNIVRPVEALDILDQEMKLLQPPAMDSIIVGSRLLKMMEAKIGDTIRLVAPAGQADNPLEDMRPFKVVGVYDSGLIHYDNKLGIVSLKAAQRLFAMDPGVVTGLEIGLREPDNSPQVAATLSSSFNLTVKQWQAYNKNIFEAMRLERAIISLIVALVAFVASFNILTTLFTLVHQKQQEISLLRALGASSRKILMVFIKQSLAVGLIGSLSGVGLGFAVSWLLKYYPFIQLPDIYLLASLPVEFNPIVYLLVALASILIAFIAGLYPAWEATRVTPTEGIARRREG